MRIAAALLLAAFSLFQCQGAEPALAVSSEDAIVDGTRIFAAGSRPIRLLVSVENGASAPAVQTVQIASKLFPANNATVKVAGGKAAIVLDYGKKLPLTEPDEVTLSAEGVERKAIFKVYPVAVKIFPKSNAEREFDWLVLEPGKGTGKLEVGYAINPWDDALENLIEFRTAFCPLDHATASVEKAAIKPQGTVVVHAASRHPDATAITALLKAPKASELSARLPVYIRTNGTPQEQAVVASPATKEQAAELDAVLLEIFPLPRDAYTQQGVRKMREVLVARYVPHVPEALRAATAADMRYILKCCVKNKELDDLVISAAKEATKYMPLAK